MPVSRDELIARLTDFLLALSRAAASVTDSAWAQALMNRGERIAQRVINPTADTVRVTMHLDSVDELLRLMPNGIVQQKLVLQARKAALTMRYALAPTRHLVEAEEPRLDSLVSSPASPARFAGALARRAGGPLPSVATSNPPEPTLRPSSDSVPKPAASVVTPRRAAKSHVISKNKEAILNFIQKTPRARTKDIIDGFNVLSQRTVKRNLKDLIRSGMVQKRAEHKAVYYFAIDLN